MHRTWLVVVWIAVGADFAPLADPKTLDRVVHDFAEKLYDRVHQASPDIYEQMQGDQPPENNDLIVNFPANQSVMDTKYLDTQKSRRQRENDLDDRARENWVEVLKQNILRQIGRANATMPLNMENGQNVTPFNMTSIIPVLLNSSVLDPDHIAEKIRSYYPSCEMPSNMDQEIWKDENVMNLYFHNFDHSDEKGMNIATATLRLYRIPSNSTKIPGTRPDDCDSSASSEEERLLRVSIYWYTRSVRKKKVKRHLSDSKVIQDNARWVELSVKPATKAWSKGRNLGLAILVEDQEGNVLRADRLFKGALCMVGASTPKPIPTIIVDAARQSNELDERIHSLLGRNSTSALSGDISMLPTIDICTLEFPENYSHPPHIANLRINACNLKKSHERAQLLAEQDKIVRLATLPEHLEPSRHIRHQRQHLKNTDPRSKMINKRILSREELQELNLLNITKINR